MPKYRIKGALSGGFGGCKNKDWVYINAKNDEKACEEAWLLACEEYYMYDGTNGILSIGEIMENEEIMEDEAIKYWYEQREFWLDYEYEKVKK